METAFAATSPVNAGVPVELKNRFCPTMKAETGAVEVLASANGDVDVPRVPVVERLMAVPLAFPVNDVVVVASPIGFVTVPTVAAAVSETNGLVMLIAGAAADCLI